MKMNKHQKAYQKALEKLAEENQKAAEKELQEIYREKRKQRDKTLECIVGLYATYKLSETGGLVLSQAEKKKVKMKTKDFLTGLAYKLGENEEKLTKKALKKTAINTYNKTNFLVDIGLSFDLPIGNLDKKTISKIVNKQLAGKSFSTRIWDNQQALINRLNKEIISVISDGKDVRKATRVVKKRFNVTSYNAKRIMQNEVKNVQTRTQEKIYKDSDVVEDVMWSATLDDRTRMEHADLDSKTWDANKTHPTPADFVMCRCSLIPIIEGYKPRKRYVQEDGSTIDFKTYREWEKNRVK